MLCVFTEYTYTAPTSPRSGVSSASGSSGKPFAVKLRAGACFAFSLNTLIRHLRARASKFLKRSVHQLKHVEPPDAKQRNVRARKNAGGVQAWVCMCVWPTGAHDVRRQRARRRGRRRKDRQHCVRRFWCTRLTFMHTNWSSEIDFSLFVYWGPGAPQGCARARRASRV